MVDARINTPADASTINGRLTDRAIELMGMLNKVIGAEGLGTNNFTFTGDLAQTLAVHVVEADYDDPQWQEKQTVYFGTTTNRLNLIQNKLNENLERIKDDIAGNVSSLFDIINSKEGLFDEYEAAVANAHNQQQLEQAQQALEAKIVQELTNDDVLNEMINAFFANIELTISRMDSEIFDLLNDYDGIYSDGTTDVAKYLVNLPNADGSQNSQILDSINDVLAAVLEKNKAIYETNNGTSSYTQAQEDSFIQAQVLGAFVNRSLKLSNEFINHIIIDQGLTAEELQGFKSSADFLKILSPAELLSSAQEFYGTTNDQSSYTELFKAHLDITTPKYYEDQRSLYDILNGKNGDSDFSNSSLIFNSIGDQITRVTNSTLDLFQHGFDKVTTSNLQDTIRRNPLSAIEYLEAAKANADEEQQEKIQKMIDDLIDKQAQIIEFTTKQEYANGADSELITRLQEMFSGVDKYKPGDAAKLKKLLKDAGLKSPDINPEEIDYDTFMGVLDESIKLPTIHNALYGTELREASQMNAQFQGRKLPEYKSDGTLPDDNVIAPPYIGPSMLSAVVAKIGDTLLNKAYNLERDTNVPTEAWMDENVQMLETINDKLPSLGMSSAGEAFIDSLRENFKDIIKDFFATSQPLKDIKDKAKGKLDKANQIQASLDYLVNQGVVNEETSKQELEALVDQLDDVNYPNEISRRQNQISHLNSQITQLSRDLQNPSLTYEEIQQIQAQIASLNSQIQGLGSAIISLSRDEEILSAGKEVLQLKNEIKGNKVKPGFKQMQDENFSNLKRSIIDYSNGLTDFTRDLDGNGEIDLEETFKASLDQANLDLDGNGQNDFVDIQGIINKIGGLSSDIQNIYGGIGAVAGGIEAQSIRRLILLMFVLSMLEGGDWDYMKSEADISRYQVL